MEIKAINFHYDSSAISQAQFLAHMKLYEGYISKLNEIDEALLEAPEREKANAVYSKYRGLKKGETFCLDSIILHEEYFSNMCAARKKPGPAAAALFDKCFGGLEGFIKDLTACGLAARGWCVTCYEQRTARLKNILCDAHDEGIILTSYPILVLDVYEHAYFLDYLTDKAAYIKAFIESINWDVVEIRASRL